MSPEVAAKMAKLLRMLTSPHDGEVLSAAGRINAVVAAHSIDWDQALTGGERGLSQGDMQEIYTTAYERGFTDGKAESSRDWTPAANTFAEAGDNFGRLYEILGAADLAAADRRLNSFEPEFVRSMQERVTQYGYQTWVSEKQWAVLDRLERKLSAQDYTARAA